MSIELIEGSLLWEGFSEPVSSDKMGIMILSGKASINSREYTGALSATQAIFIANNDLEVLYLENAQAIIFSLIFTDHIISLLSVPLVIDELSTQIIRDVFLINSVNAEHQKAAITLICHQLSSYTPSPDETYVPYAQPGGKEELPDITQTSLTWMRENIDMPVTLEKLANHTGCTKTKLINEFKKANLLPPMKQLAQMRIEKASELLQENKLSIIQVAREVGYTTQASFSHFFKRHTGRSPRDYRDECLWLT